MPGWMARILGFQGFPKAGIWSCRCEGLISVLLPHDLGLHNTIRSLFFLRGPVVTLPCNSQNQLLSAWPLRPRLQTCRVPCHALPPSPSPNHHTKVSQAPGRLCQYQLTYAERPHISGVRPLSTGFLAAVVVVVVGSTFCYFK